MNGKPPDDFPPAPGLSGLAGISGTNVPTGTDVLAPPGAVSGNLPTVRSTSASSAALGVAEEEPAPPNSLSATTLIGDRVINGAGEELGKLEEIMIDLDSGRVAYLVLSFGGFLGIGDKLFAIPWEAIRVDTERKALILNVQRETLEHAPGFDKHNWPDNADRTWLAKVYDYYGYKSYWRS